MDIKMMKVVLDMTNEETYKESLLELFDYDSEAVSKSFYSHGAGKDIEKIVYDAFNNSHIKAHNFELHDLGNKRTLLVAAWIDE